VDPVTLAMLTSAVSILGSEYLKGVASEAGKSTWSAIKSIFGWKDDPKVEDVPQKVASALHASPQLGEKIFVLLKNNQSAGVAAAMVGKIEAEKVINIQTMQGGTINM
jgi:hypothetical protein